MLHKSNFRYRVGTGGASLQCSLSQQSYISERFFGLHFYRRQYGVSFDHFDVVGHKATDFGEITQSNSNTSSVSRVCDVLVNVAVFTIAFCLLYRLDLLLLN